MLASKNAFELHVYVEVQVKAPNGNAIFSKDSLPFKIKSIPCKVTGITKATKFNQTLLIGDLNEGFKFNVEMNNKNCKYKFKAISEGKEVNDFEMYSVFNETSKLYNLLLSNKTFPKDFTFTLEAHDLAIASNIQPLSTPLNVSIICGLNATNVTSPVIVKDDMNPDNDFLTIDQYFTTYLLDPFTSSFKHCPINNITLVKTEKGTEADYTINGTLMNVSSSLNDTS
jgi:hypothetical protein